MIAARFITDCYLFAQKCVNVLLRGCGVLVLTLIVIPSVQAAASCQVSATGPIFGIYNPLDVSPTLSIGSVTARCTLSGRKSTTVSITSSYSSGNSGNFSSRSMTSGANVLSYNLYYDAAYTQIRGDGTGGSITGGASFTLTSSDSEQQTTSTIYGRIPAGQDVAAGSYTDTIVVTLTY